MIDDRKKHADIGPDKIWKTPPSPKKQIDLAELPAADDEEIIDIE